MLLRAVVLSVALVAFLVAEPAFARSASPGANRHLEPPNDAPSLHATVKRPEPPSSYNVHEAGWIRFYYPPEVRRLIQPLIEGADSSRAELIQKLGQTVLSDVSVFVARTPGEMSTLAPEGAPYPKYADGVAYSSLGLVLLTTEAQNANTRHDLSEVFKHELAHVALFDALEGRAVPRWFNEGFAVFASGESSYQRLQTLWTATLAETLIPLKQLERDFPRDALTASVAYAEAADVVRFLVRTQERHRFERLVDSMRRGRDFESALQAAYGLEVPALEYEWRQEVARRYTFWPVFFSGGFIWVGAVLLFVWGWKRRRSRNLLTMERWDREEAAARAQQLARAARSERERVHIVFPRTPTAAQAGRGLVALRRDVDVPKVEHGGRWHTLH